MHFQPIDIVHRYGNINIRFDNLLQELHALHVVRNWPTGAHTRIPEQRSFQPEAETAGWLTYKNTIMYFN